MILERFLSGIADSSTPTHSAGQPNRCVRAEVSSRFSLSRFGVTGVRLLGGLRKHAEILQLALL